MSVTKATKDQVRERLLSKDPRDVPAYLPTEAARYLRIPPATLRSWVLGRAYPRGSGIAHFDPLILLPESSTNALSFNNIVEAHVLNALRRQHAVSIHDVRTALDYAEKELGIKRLLLREELRTTGGQVFLKRYGQLINLSRSGQIAMEKLLEAYLRRVEWDQSSVPVRLFPFVAPDDETPRKVVIDPRVAFGRPVIWPSAISTSTIVERIDAGESQEAVAADYGLNNDEVEEAVLYERAA